MEAISTNIGYYLLLVLAFLFSSISFGLCQNAVSNTPNPRARVSAAVSPPEFKVDDREGPCVLMKINATIVIEPIRTANKKYLVDVPHRAEAKGKCGNGEDSQIIITWNSFRFGWHFQKIRMSDAWKVDSIEFGYNTSEKVFGGEIEAEGLPGHVELVKTGEPFNLWLTPLSSSYSCGIEQNIKLLDPKKEKRVTIKLRKIEIQPFAAMTRRRYGDSFMCPEEAGRRDETVPLAVGTTLAIAVLCTVGGYAGYRYMKVKKVEYDTIE